MAFDSNGRILIPKDLIKYKEGQKVYICYSKKEEMFYICSPKTDEDFVLSVRTCDSKNRIFFPSQFRKDFEGKIFWLALKGERIYLITPKED